MKGGNGKPDELTFEQPEEIAHAKVKPDGAAVIRNLSRTHFCANESGTAGEFISRLSKKFERRDFFIFRKKKKKKIISDKTGGTEK